MSRVIPVCRALRVFKVPQASKVPPGNRGPLAHKALRDTKEPQDTMVSPAFKVPRGTRARQANRVSLDLMG